MPTSIRKVGGSHMVAIPPTYLEQLGLKAGEKVDWSVREGELVLYRPSKPTLDDLLDQTDPQTPEHDSLWLDGDAIEGEML